MVFQSELNKLNHEYRKCANDYVKSQIKEDISFLYTVLKGLTDKETEMEMS